MSISFRKRFIA